MLPADGVPERYREREDGHYYGGPRFAARVADPLGVALLEPHDGWLDGLPDAFTGRSVSRVRLSEARRRTGPLFVKPPTDKSFPAAVHPDGACLPQSPPGSGDPLVQISEVVAWEDEFRLFLLDGEIRTGSRYAVRGRLDPAPLAGHPEEAAVHAFRPLRLAEECGDTLPGGVVVDVGRMSRPGRAMRLGGRRGQHGLVQHRVRRRSRPRPGRGAPVGGPRFPGPRAGPDVPAGPPRRARVQGLRQRCGRGHRGVRRSWLPKIQSW